MEATSATEKTPLTETQARALAHWWCGDYQRLESSSPEGPLVRHGVFLVLGNEPGARPGTPSSWAVFSLEEAQEVERHRSEVNPGAPDWVG